MGMGPLHQNSNMVQKHFAGERTTQWVLERKTGGISILNDVIMLFFSRPTASHALQQGVFVTRDCLAAKGTHL